MDALKRGWIGLALFSAALVLMPILVFGYDAKDSSSVSSPKPSPLPGAGRSGRADPFGSSASVEPVAPLSFTGVRPGETIGGFRSIRVETNGYSGPLRFVLNGPIDPYSQDILGPPYLFAPFTDGWQTTAVPDGLYTLTAIPTGSSDAQISISFTVSNSLGTGR